MAKINSFDRFNSEAKRLVHFKKLKNETKLFNSVFAIDRLNTNKQRIVLPKYDNFVVSSKESTPTFSIHFPIINSTRSNLNTVFYMRVMSARLKSPIVTVAHMHRFINEDENETIR